MYTLDDDDIRILQLLQHDARMTNKEIGDKIGKSVSPVYERIKRLQQGGYIKHFAVILDNKLIQKSLIAFTNIRLKAHSHAMMLGFEIEVIRLTEVMECFYMTGEYDFLLKIAVKDMDEYYDFVINKLSRLSNVGTVQSFFVLKESKRITAYSLDMSNKNKRGNVFNV